MAENAGIPAKPRRRYLKFLLVFLALFLLFLAYGAGTIVFPLSIYGTFQNKNCDSALRWYQVYANLYPVFLQDKTLVTPALECQAYGSAASQEKNGSWREAYDAYQVYVNTYPNGLYVEEAHEHSGLVLVNIAKEQVEQKKYEEAVGNLNCIVSDYSDTSAGAETWALASSIYTPWGRQLRETKDFEASERVLNDFKSWSEHYQQTNLVTDAQRELVVTYLAWGQDLQSQKEFGKALLKFELAAAADPQAQFDSATQVKESPSRLYIAWGNDLLEQKDFPGAIQKFGLAVDRAESATSELAKDALANGYLQWASALSSTEDFLGALEQLKLAQGAASSDTMKKSVETALQDTYLAFSKSTGQQARRAMKDILATVCDKHKAPDLPIFGIDKDTIRFAMYGEGVEEHLPAELTARSPGEMHYIACIKTDNRTVQSRTHKNIILKFGGGYWYTLEQQYRVQIVWKASLRKTDTGESIGEQSFTGAEPPPFSEVGGNYFFGLAPMDEFKAWLETFRK